MHYRSMIASIRVPYLVDRGSTKYGRRLDGRGGKVAVFLSLTRRMGSRSRSDLPEGVLQ
jgi:hypothetical protein